jgi:hypothetical protein
MLVGVLPFAREELGRRVERRWPTAMAPLRPERVVTA